MLKKILKLLEFYSSFNHYFICCPIFFRTRSKQNWRPSMQSQVSFAEADLSLFKNFPNANVTLEN
jgi:hypothetical protein